MRPSDPAVAHADRRILVSRHDLRRNASSAVFQLPWVMGTPEVGGSEHCHGDNRIVGSNYGADCLADKL